VRIVSPFFPTVVMSSRCSVRVGLGCDPVDVFATLMLIASAKAGGSSLVTASAGVSAEKKCAYDNQAGSFGLS
jgi:hypothetical protein